MGIGSGWGGPTSLIGIKDAMGGPIELVLALELASELGPDPRAGPEPIRGTGPIGGVADFEPLLGRALLLLLLLLLASC